MQLARAGTSLPGRSQLWDRPWNKRGRLLSSLEKGISPHEANANARANIYARARNLLSTELAGARPRYSPERTIAERSALEEAIERVEAENRGRFDRDGSTLASQPARKSSPTNTQASTARFSIWPVLMAPFVAGIYYLSIRTAFAQSIVSVLGRNDFFDAPHWGTHWLYRVVAEVISVYFGTFIAAGLAPGREHTAAVLGGCAIAIGYIIKLGLTYLAWKANTLNSLEPWYQSVIDSLMAFAPPIIAFSVVETAQQVHRDIPHSFGGINRLHFLWLWLVSYFYALGLITPVARWYAFQDESTITDVILLFVNGIPTAAIAFPGYYGVALLAGYHGNTMYPAGRNLIGVLVLIFGLLVGLIVEESWYWLMQRLYEFISA
jgi:hypothetical protein